MHLDSGRDVVVLCEGDPLFYGSFMYLLVRLADRFAVEIVPGVNKPVGLCRRPGSAPCGAKRQADRASRHP